MHTSAIYDPRATATPSQRRAADDHLARLKRIGSAAKPLPEEESTSRAIAVMPPIPNSDIKAAWDLIPDGAHPWGQVETIQRCVIASYLDVSFIDLKSARRTAIVVRARQIAMYLCKTLTERSLPDIGRRFGGRDHTTVLHAVRKIGALVNTDPKLAAEIDGFKKQLEGL